ncbi:cuticle protein 16.5 [Drosophila rhopaloa]|uniref:Cuticle protein 16.5 n=1 Tax=Drosophila rhopaloa TaxID=1041015 RepID=A0ABM5HNN9_DRORH|nr:cuticle protein 16.5 [Drosophila rhopaloa]
MFKLFVLAALLAVAAAKPGHLAAAPLVYSAPATTVVQEPVLAKVGAVVKSVPTAVSHQSLTQVHSSPVVEDVVAPVVRTTAVHSAPVVAAAPIVKTVAPVAYSAPLAYSAPVAYSSYSSPLTYSAPLSYSAPVAYSAPLSYAAPAPLLHQAPLTYAASSW